MRRRRHNARAPQALAFRVAALGLGIVLLPVLLGRSVLSAAFRPLAPMGWLMLLGGAIGLMVLRRRSHTPAVEAPKARVSPTNRVPPPHPARALRRTERLDPASVDEIEAARGRRNPPDDPAMSARNRPVAWGPKVFAIIEWRRFEAVVECLFGQAGFVTKSQSHGPDDGIDVWLYSKHQPDGSPVSLVQCKHWQGKPVGVDKVRELRGVMAAKGVSRGQFATTSTYTPDAIAFAGNNAIKLHDGAGLLELIMKRTPAQQQALLDVALDGDYWRPTCARCGSKMMERQPTAGGKPFWGCVNFPNCRTTMQMRAA